MYAVAGATGNVGAEVVAALRSAGEEVRALTRATSSATLPADVHTATVDLDDPDSFSGALTGVRGVFLLAGYADMAGLCAAARTAGVERVVLLSSGAVVGGDVANVVVRHNVVSEAALHDSGLPGAILRPSGFDSNARQWIDQVRAGNVIRETFADVPVAAIDPADIGAVAARALVDVSQDVARYRLTGPEPIRPADRVATLADILDRELILEPIPDDEVYEYLLSTMPRAYADAFYDFYGRGTYDDSRVDQTVENLLGRPARTFRQWADAHADEFR